MYSKPPAIRFSTASATAPPPSPAQNTPMVARGAFFCRHQKEVKTLFWELQDTRGGFAVGYSCWHGPWLFLLAGSGYLRGSTSELIYFASSAYGNDPDAPCSFISLTKSMRYYPAIQTQSVLARAPTNPSMGVLLVVIAPAAELIVVTPSPPSTSCITLRPRGGSPACFLTRIMTPFG